MLFRSRLLAAKASPVRPGFIPSVAQAQAAAAGKPSGQPLAGTSSPRLNAALALLCGLQVHSAADAPAAAAVSLR